MKDLTFGHLGSTFQETLIKAIIEDKKFGETIISVIDSKYFDNNSFRYIMENIKEIHETYNRIPDYLDISQKIMSESKDSNSGRIHLDTLDNIKNNTQKIDIVKDKSLNFCRQQNLKKELKIVQNIIDNGDFEQYQTIEGIIQKALEVGVVSEDAISVFTDIDSALEKDFREPIPTGIVGLDNLLKGGLGIGELAVLLAPTGVGKSLGNSEPVLTPNGWTEMGKIRLGDKVIGSDGKPQYVTGVFPQGLRKIYRIDFTDNTFVNCDEEHLWSVNTLNMRESKTRKNGVVIYKPNNGFITLKTSEMINSIKKRGRFNYRLPSICPVEFNKIKLTIDPYLMGLFLGDGFLCEDCSSNITTKDDEIFDNIKHLSEHTSFNEYLRNNNTLSIKRILFKKNINNRLKDYGLLGKKSNNKFIPNDYLFNSLEDRVSLLQGLMDTDGYISKSGTIQYTTVSEQLSKDVRELVLSLGGKAKIKLKTPYYTYKGIRKKGQLSYVITISFSNNIVPFKLSRKIIRYNKRTKYVDQKFIKSIEYSHEENATCIKVSNTDELFVTRDYVLTHNTTFLTKVANTAYNCGKNVLQLFFEDNKDVIKRKHFTIWSGISPDEQPDFKEEVIEKIKEAESLSQGELRLLKLPSSSVTVSDIKSRIRKMKSEGFKIDLLVIDYVDCIIPEKTVFGEEWKGDGPIMRSIEAMCDEFNIAIWVATQGNRDSIASEVVTTDQMGGSIKKAQIGHVIVSVGKTLEQKEHNLATMTLLKSRIGKDGIVFTNCLFNNEFIIIDTETQSTLLGIKEEKEQEKVNRQREAFNRRQQLKGAE